MGFYVPTNRDVKFPKACEQCHFYDGLLCCVMDTYVHDPENKHEECPLIEIPDNHGRLIDTDALKKILVTAIPQYSLAGCTTYADSDIMRWIDEVPTVIPAGPEEEEMK